MFFSLISQNRRDFQILIFKFRQSLCDCTRSMLFPKICFSATRSGPFLFSSTLANPFIKSTSYPTFSLNLQTLRLGLKRTTSANSHSFISLHTTNSTMDNRGRPPVPIPESANRAELFRALESNLGSTFSSDPIIPNPNPLIIVISGPSGVGKDSVIKRLREVRENLHFVVTATSRAKRPGEVDGKDYIFVSKEEFLKMIEKDELLEYALVYGDYKGVPKQQIREYMGKGCDIVLRVDIQGVATLRGMLRDNAVFVFLAAESEEAVVRRLIGRKTESVEALMMRVGRAREELRHLKEFDYVVVNKEGELERSVKLVESIIEAEKAKVQQRGAVI